MPDTTLKDPLQKFRFRVNISGGGYKFTRLGFSKVRGLSGEYEETEYREGGDNRSKRKLPGMMKYEDIVMERGMMADEADIWNAFMLIARGNPNFRFEITVSLLDTVTGEEKKTWSVHRAWFKKVEGDELDANSNDVAIERATLAHEGCEAA